MINQMIDAHTKKKEIKNEPIGKQKHKKGIIIVLGFGAIKRI